jgi:hypothetical protein
MSARAPARTAQLAGEGGLKQGRADSARRVDAPEIGRAVIVLHPLLEKQAMGLPFISSRQEGNSTRLRAAHTTIRNT